MTSEDVFFEDQVETIQIRMIEWQPELKAEGPLQLEQLKRMAAASVRLDICLDEESDWLYRQASRTDDVRLLHQKIEIEEMAEGLMRRPAKVALKLQESQVGCDWILVRLRVLAELIRGGGENGTPGPLDAANRNLAFNVLGVAPERRLVQSPLDPPVPAGTGAGAGAEKPSDAEVAAHQAGVIAAEIARLETLRNGLANLEGIDRDANALGREIKPDARVRRIRRNEAAAQRAYDRAFAELVRLQGLAAEARRIAKEAALARLLEAPRVPQAEAVPAAPPAAAAAVVAPAADDIFESAMREVFPPAPAQGPHQSRDERKKRQAARAAHLGFPQQ